LTAVNIGTGDDRKCGYSERFPRPQFTGPSKGAVRIRHVKTKKRGVGSNLKPSITLNHTDHPLHFLELWLDDEWQEKNMAVPTRDAMEMDAPYGIPSAWTISTRRRKILYGVQTFIIINAVTIKPLP
jgi:hypothetical protein